MKRSKPLHKMSANLSGRMTRYRKLVEQAGRIWSHCLRCNKSRALEPHHLSGRSGENLFRFLMICRPCHNWIHTHTKQAKKDGWLVDSLKIMNLIPTENLFVVQIEPENG